MAIQPFNAKIQNILGDKMVGKSLWGIFYGVELEYEIDPKSDIVTKFVESHPQEKRRALFAGEEHKQNTPVAHYVCDALYPLVKDFAIIKRDGSLKNGIEIVSLPMSQDAHRTQWENFFNNASKFGLMVRATCGMHVHASRELMGHLQIGKILSFIHDPNNEAFIKLIAGRKPPADYANITEKKTVSDVKKHSDTKVKANRYDGFNITGGATIEFRFFKGTMSMERMLTNLDFCAAMVGFTWPGVVGLNKNNLAGFLEFMQDRRSRKDYPYLYQFLIAKNLIPPLKPTTNSKGRKNAKPIAA